jgi:signal transduction histidine kinase
MNIQLSGTDIGTIPEQQIKLKSSLVTAMHRFARFSGLAVIAMASLTLIGWLTGIYVLASLVPGLTAMNITTAICMLLAGFALWRRTAPVVTDRDIAITNICAIIIGIVGSIHLLNVIFDWDFNIDRLSEFLPFLPKFTPNRMAPYSAVNFILMSIGLLYFSREIRPNLLPAQVLGLVISLVSFLILIGYAFTLLSFTPVAARFISMPLNTALAFVLLGTGLLHALADRGPMQTVTGDYLGSYMIRRLLPVAAGLPIALGWLRLAGQQQGLFSLEAGSTFFATVMIVVISSLIWFIARSLNKTDMQRQMAEENLRQTNEAMHRTNIALQEANALKTELLHIAAHDMKNPLGAIRTMAEIIQSSPENQDIVSEMSALVYASSNQMLKLIEELLKTAALDNGKLELHLERVDMSYLLQIVTDGNTTLARKKEQTLSVHTEKDCLVEGDFSRLREVLDNLVSNAIKYSPIGKNIIIRLSRNDHTVRLEICDDGPGLSTDDMQKLFGKFQRLHAQPTGGESSTGLGLSIVKQLVELHKGMVWAESDGRGKGATFIVELPLMAPSPGIYSTESVG